MKTKVNNNGTISLMGIKPKEMHSFIKEMANKIDELEKMKGVSPEAISIIIASELRENEKDLFTNDLRELGNGGDSGKEGTKKPSVQNK